MFLEGIAEFMMGMGIIAWSRRRDWRERERHQEDMVKELLRREIILKEREVQLDLMERRMKSRDPLERMTVEDALAREGRAKAALRAVLAQYGVCEEGIEDVLNSVDGHRDGDG